MRLWAIAIGAVLHCAALGVNEMNSYEMKLERRRARLQHRAERFRAIAEAKHKAAGGILAYIPPGQPILVGHHSERRHRRDLAKVDSNMRAAIAATKAAAAAESQAASVGSAGISSDDPEAAHKIKEEIAALEAQQEKMKAANLLVRKGDVAALAAMFNESIAQKLMQPDFCGRKGFADFELRNNGANIRRLKARLEQMQARSSHKAATEEYGAIRIEALPGENRVRVFFPGKPARDVIADMKAAGFKWAPSVGAWQRFYSAGSLWHAQSLAKKHSQTIGGRQ